jgi:hypothetical protein
MEFHERCKYLLDLGRATRGRPQKGKELMRPGSSTARPPSVERRVRQAARFAAAMGILTKYPDSFDLLVVSPNTARPSLLKFARSCAPERVRPLLKKLYSDWEPCPHGPRRLRIAREEEGKLTLREALATFTSFAATRRETAVPEARVLAALFNRGGRAVPLGLATTFSPSLCEGALLLPLLTLLPAQRRSIMRRYC